MKIIGFTFLHFMRILYPQYSVVFSSQTALSDSGVMQFVASSMICRSPPFSVILES